MFDVFRVTFILALTAGFAVHLSASEPASSPTNTLAPGAIAAKPDSLTESDVRELLTAKLQRDYVQDRGKLELVFSQPWKTIQAPPGPLDLRILNMPTMGVTSYFIASFELRADGRSLGSWQIPVQAHVWRDVWVARSPLSPGQLLADADIALERRDVLSINEPLAQFPSGDRMLEVAQPLQAGAVLLARFVRLRAVVHRGQMVDALVEDGALTVTIKVQALEDGAPGQLVRARNLQSLRDIRGKVINDETILVSM